MNASDSTAPTPHVAAAYRDAAEASPHVPSLDGVRGIAVLLVLVFHVWPSPWTAFGWAGVDLFFVLSGYLITGVLVDGRAALHRCRTFYVRRALRIMPLYYGVLFVLYVVLPLVHPLHDAVYAQIVQDQAWFWTYTSNWLIALRHPHFDYVNHFWSLAVEEQFYLVWPLIVWYASRETAARIAGAAIVGALLCRLAMVASGAWWPATYFLTPCRLDALGVGALVALWLREPGDFTAVLARTRVRMRRGAILVALTLVAATAVGWGLPIGTLRLPQTVNLTVIAWMFGWLVMVAATRQPAMLRWKPLRLAGLYSYGLYIIHPFVFAFVTAHWRADHDWFARGALVTAVSLLFAWMSYHGYERHFLRLKDRLAPTGGGLREPWTGRPPQSRPAAVATQT